MLERAVVAFDKGGRGDLDQVPEHQTALDEAFHFGGSNSTIADCSIASGAFRADFRTA